MTKKNVPAAELEVLACLQKLGQATAREIRQDLHAFRPMTHGALLNLLKRLDSKHLVTRKKAPVGKAYIYQATGKVDSVYRKMLGRLVNRVFAGDILAVVALRDEATGCRATGPPRTDVEQTAGKTG